MFVCENLKSVSGCVNGVKISADVILFFNPLTQKKFILRNESILLFFLTNNVLREKCKILAKSNYKLLISNKTNITKLYSCCYRVNFVYGRAKINNKLK